MKKQLLILLTVFTSAQVCAQKINYYENSEPVFNPFTNDFGAKKNNRKLNNKNSINAKSIDFNCEEVFWTIDSEGNIQQWSLYNDTVSGGEIIVTNGGRGGLAQLADSNEPNFYCTNYPNTDIIYYTNQKNWTTIPITVSVLNNGGYENHQYYMGTMVDSDLGFSVNKILYYFNGVSLETIITLESQIINVGDIAVDGNGLAWVFQSEELLSVTSLNAYNSEGLVSSFDIEFDSTGSYGSFFLNDFLYIGMSSTGTNPNSITPVILNGSTAELGTPIPFLNDSYYDMASCQDSNPLNIDDLDILKNSISIYPNPTNDIINLPRNLDLISVKIFSSNGQLLRKEISNVIDLSDLINGVYIIQIITKSRSINKKVIKY